jgi:hypothetical protein
MPLNCDRTRHGTYVSGAAVDDVVTLNGAVIA